MRNSLLLSSAAALLTATAASAADLPTKKAAPVEYVRICSLGGGVFVGYVIPGSDVCLKVGGFARWQYTNFSNTNSIVQQADGSWAGSRGFGKNTAGQSAQGAVQLDARTQTEFGLLRSYVDIRGSAGFGGSSAFIDKAWVQLGGFQAGKYTSYFDFYGDAFNNLGQIGSDHSVVGAAYTAIFGNFSVALSLEDTSAALGFPNYFGLTSTGKPLALDYTLTASGNRIPDPVVRFLYADSWGQVQLSGAMHQVRANVDWQNIVGTTDVYKDETKYGWAIQGGVKLNVPTFGPGDALYLQAAYTDGALLYVGANGSIFGAGGIGTAGKASEITYGADAMPDVDTGSLKTTKGWNALAAFQHSFTPSLSAALWGGYTNVDYAKNTYGRDFHYWQAGVQGNWSPVKNLTVSGTVNYINVSAQSLDGDTEAFKNLKRSSDGVGFALRVQRDF